MNSIKTPFLEVAAVVLTGAGKFVFTDFLHLKFWYVTIACLLWAGYIIFRISKDPGVTKRWGFQKEGFKSTLRIVLPISIVAILTFVVTGLIRNTMIFNWHLLPILVLYPLWGTIQQFMIMGLVAGNLADSGWKISRVVVIIASSVIFSVVHFPVLPLVVATFFLAIFYTILFMKYRNLWILGLFHGVLGGCFYFFVLGRDPWLEFIAMI